MTTTSGKDSRSRSKRERNVPSDQGEQSTYQVRLPGFITGDEIGLGDVIKKTSSYLGMQPCGGCEQRAAKLNRWLAFTPRRSR